MAIRQIKSDKEVGPDNIQAEALKADVAYSHSLSPGDRLDHVDVNIWVGKHGIQWTSRMQLDDLDVADDLALLLHKQQQIQERNSSEASAQAAVGLKIH
ncbi:unnamed protein product [Schistosoma margrebowiei]|uniref:Uncharacterized protein n=1 Tax=Schistosoma margrebowiei TaxID=48269 RepID=A0A183N9A0_9TREM|nr:unnamed protein product [Schistosoma margrebowiei]